MAFRRTSAGEGSPIGSFFVRWLLLAEDCWGSKIVRVAILSYIGVEVSSSNVRVVTGVAGNS